jgi:hypothetical protein
MRVLISILFNNNTILIIIMFLSLRNSLSDPQSCKYLTICTICVYIKSKSCSFYFCYRVLYHALVSSHKI